MILPNSEPFSGCNFSATAKKTKQNKKKQTQLQFNSVTKLKKNLLSR